MFCQKLSQSYNLFGVYVYLLYYPTALFIHTCEIHDGFPQRLSRSYFPGHLLLPGLAISTVYRRSYQGLGPRMIPTESWYMHEIRPAIEVRLTEHPVTCCLRRYLVD